MKIALENFYGKLKMVDESANLDFPCLEITVDKDDNISLTDLWKVGGSTPNKEVKDWLRLSSTDAFINAATRLLKVEKSHLIKVKRGKGGGTFADKQIALEYAQYLDPDLAILVNQVYFERVEEQHNPETAIDRAIKDWKRQGKDDVWISTRLRSKAQRNEFTATLSQHGVRNNGTQDNGFSRCTNAIYIPLLGGDAKSIKQRQRLPAKASVRDNLSGVELASVMLSEALSSENIKAKNLHGNDECEHECKTTSTNVTGAVMASRNTQPRIIGQ